MNGPRWMMPGAIYVYRTRKPGALLGLPVLGRHTAYVGQTRNLKARHQEHTRGGGRYGQEAKPWADLSPKRYVIFKMKRCPQWLLNLVEILAIRILFPVYNVQHNKGNPRRIKPRTAKRHRGVRDLAGARWSPHLNAGHLVGVAILVALVTMAWSELQS